MQKRKIILPIVAAVMLALGFLAWTQRVVISDTILASTYTVPAEISKVEEKIGLTAEGDRIFRASQPSLEGTDAFNNHCESYDTEISVLGCYTGGRIYIYDVKDGELSGVVESTAAHELLHAVWKRLDSGEQSRISKLLLEVYDDARYHNLLADDLDTYGSLERIDELHSRVGTEIAELPAELETHFAKYFNNQDLIVDFYNSYIEPFKELAEERDELKAELSQLDEEIEGKTEDYYRRAEELSKKVSEFNTCANTLNCFATDYAFSTARNALVAEQTAVGLMYEEVNGLIEEYNKLVNEYNANVLRDESLERKLNSNAQAAGVL